MRTFTKLLNFFVIFILTMGIAFADTEDRLGKMHDNVYQNDYFGFSITFPKGWNALNHEQRLKITKNAIKLMAGKDKKLKALIESGLVKKLYLFNVSKLPLGTPSNIAFIGRATDLSTSELKSATGKQFLEIAKHGMQKISRLKFDFDGDISETDIGGIQFAQMKLRLNIRNMTIHEYVYAAPIKGYMLTIVVAYPNDKDLALVKQVLATAKFQK